MKNTVDIIVFSMNKKKDPELLLIKRKYPPFKDHWALPGGFIAEDEPFITSAYRELEEETCLKDVHLIPLGIFDEVERDPRGRTISMAFWGITNKRAVKGSSDAKIAKWFSTQKLPPLAFDHEKIIKKVKDTIKNIYEMAKPLIETAHMLKGNTLKTLVENI